MTARKTGWSTIPQLYYLTDPKLPALSSGDCHVYYDHLPALRRLPCEPGTHPHCEHCDK